MGFTAKKPITKQQADEAYRNGMPLMSDSEYEEQFGINASDMDTPIADSNLGKIKHVSFMASLRKIKSIGDDGNVTFDELLEWARLVFSKTGIIATWKYDGLAVELVYVDCKFTRAVTRGDGEYGEDITAHVLQMQNLRTNLPESYQGTVVLKAEIVMLHDDFKNYLIETTDKKPYANPRNGASGAARSGRNCEYCFIEYYGYYDENSNTLDEFTMFKLFEKDFNIHSTHHKMLACETDLKILYNDMLFQRDHVGVEVDGIVFCYNNANIKNEMGVDSKNKPNYKVAFKFPAPEKTTILKSIEWQVGKTGTITPVGIIVPVDLGVTVTKASLANLGNIERKQIMPGDEVVVSRRGDVIPHIEKSLTEHLGFCIQYPLHCPLCETETTIRERVMPNGIINKTLICPNSECSGLGVGNLKKWINTMKEHFRFQGIGPERIEEIYELGMATEVNELYELEPHDLMKSMERIGEKSAHNILLFQLYKEIPLHVFMGGLNIAGLGKSLWEQLIEEGGYDSIESLLYYTEISETQAIMELEALEIEGFASKRIIATVEGLKNKAPLIRRLISIKGSGITTFVEESNVKSGNIEISEKSFCITGTLSEPRSTIESKIKLNGGIIKGVSKKLDYLIVGENPGSKVAKAEKAGVKIINESELDSMLEAF